MCNGASSSHFSAAPQSRGHSRRARRRASGCGASARFARQRDDAEYKARMTAFLQELQQLGWSDGRNVRIDTRWAAAMPILFAIMRPNWSRLRRMLSWPLAVRVWARCYKRPALCRLCSRPSSIRSALASLIAWRGPGATPLGSSRSNTA